MSWGAKTTLLSLWAADPARSRRVARLSIDESATNRCVRAGAYTLVATVAVVAGNRWIEARGREPAIEPASLV